MAVFEPLSLYNIRALIRNHGHRNRHDCFRMPYVFVFFISIVLDVKSYKFALFK